MTSEKDEFFYHENLVHVAAITHPAPTTALIIGGGDGGSAEELLKYPSIKSVTLVEIDLAVVDIARKYLPRSIAAHCPIRGCRFGRGRLRLSCAASTETYDLIVLDLTDPGGPSANRCTTSSSIAPARRASSRSGAMSPARRVAGVASGARPRGHRRSARGLRRRDAVPGVDSALRRLVDDGLRVRRRSIPSYLTPLEADRRIAQRGLRDLQYYNGEIHRASMALPNFVRELIA